MYPKGWTSGDDDIQPDGRGRVTDAEVEQIFSHPYRDFHSAIPTQAPSPHLFYNEDDGFGYINLSEIIELWLDDTLGLERPWKVYLRGLQEITKFRHASGEKIYSALKAYRSHNV